MMENTDWSQVKGSPNYPYLNNTLLPDSAYANNYIGGISHTSLPNYVTLEAGDPMGLTDGSYLPPTHSASTTDHLVTQLRTAGISWKYYAENLPGNGTTCNITDPGTPYSLDHNAFVYFDDVRNDPAYCQSHERPYSEFANDLTNNTVPNYNFIVPNDWNQGEKLAPGSTCMACQADNFLKSEIPKIQASAAYANGGAIVVLWDESASTGSYPSGMIVNSPLAKKNYSNNIAYNHGSTLRTMQTIFGVGPFLRMAATATDLSDFFTVPLTTGASAAPVASFTATPTSGTAPLNVAFTDTSTGSPTSWAWDFGDGGTSTVQNPTHNYAAAGTYTAKITATNATGSGSATSTITVTTAGQAPVASFTAAPTSGTAPLNVAFTDTSTGTPTSWAWDFGDGGTSTTKNPTHNYAAAGTYTAKLTATNATGSGSATSTITVTTATTTTPLELNDATVGTGLNQFTYSGSWSVSNPATAYKSDNHFANATNASYQVQFTGTQAKIFAEKSPALGIIGVSIDGGTETKVDPYASSRSEQNLLYTSPILASGTHTLKVRITGTKNASATGTYAAADRVEITASGTTPPPAPAPVASFTAAPTSGTAPLNVAFTDTSTGSPTSWAWDFGDGGTSTTKNPTHNYTAAGTYTAKLTATNATGSGSATSTITVTTAGQAPLASFTANPTSGTAPLNVAFTDTSTGSPTSWAWDFGDGGTSTTKNPTHNYAAAGTYTAKLTATNATGSGSATSTITVTTATTTTPLELNDATVGTGLNQFTYSGSWSVSNPATAYKSDNHFANATNASYQVQFTGTQAKIFAEKSPALGIIGVSIDGGTETKVDPYASSRSEQNLLYTSPALASGIHTLKVRITGTKNASSTGTYAAADRIEILSN